MAPGTSAPANPAGPALLALCLCAFGIGTGEFVMPGLMPAVAAGIGVDLSTAALLVSGYACGVAVGGPILTLSTMAVGRRDLLLAVMGLALAGNLACALAPSYPMLLAGRLTGAVAHGAFHGIASVVACSLASEDRRGRAVSLIGAAVTLATIMGVPVGIVIGQALGWRATFWSTGALALIGLLAVLLTVPADRGDRSTQIGPGIATLGRPRVLLGLFLCILLCLGLFAVFTCIAPIATRVSGASDDDVPVLLLLFGLGAAGGTLASGRSADRTVAGTLRLAFSGQAIALAVVVAAGSNLLALQFMVVLLGFFGMGAVTPLKLLVLDAAREAPRLASTLASSALNLGVALGAGLAALMMEWDVPLLWLAFPGIATSGLALLLVAWCPTAERSSPVDAPAPGSRVGRGAACRPSPAAAPPTGAREA